MIIYLAAYLADRQPLMQGLIPLLAPTLLMSGLALLLLLIQRDLGTAWVFIFIYTIMIYAATGERRILYVSLASIALALVLGFEFIPLVHARIEAWLNPWLDPAGRSYQIVQGLLAIAAGGLLGRGPGMGSPGYVPVAHTDFIYTSILEEMGLIGGVRDTTGLDRLAVETGDGEGGASVTGGRYAAEGVYVGVEQGLDEQSSRVNVEVELTPNVTVESDVGADAQGRIGVRVEWDY